jgi:2-polyprenyl-3-methyl-5-hydroxy-6-metoxy-1,4-benzoquinol methylase
MRREPRVIDQATIDAHKWFHAIDFGDVSSPGRIPPNRPPNYTLFGIYSFLDAIDIAGLDVIDLGTMDGLMAFMLKRLGASRVAATDLWDRPQFRLAREILAYEDEVEYHTSLDIRDMHERFGDRAFDLMVLGGVLYHLLSPLEALIACRRLLRRDGLLLLETCFDESSQDMHLRFNMGMDPAPFNEPTTYFLPTVPALLALLRTASFDPIRVARLQHGSARVSVLARAVRPSAVRNKTEVQGLHDRYVDSPTHFAFGDTFYSLEHDDQSGSRAIYAGPPSLETEIDVMSYVPSVPLQPTWSRPL